jgi:signal transduction histidine kinase
MSADLDHANQLRRQMTADIAHDLRTPLTVITGYLEGMQDGTLKPTRARFDTMFAEATQLQRLIEDLRTLSLADAGELKLNRQSIAPDELLRDVQASFQPLAGENRIALAVESNTPIPPVSLDRERMIRVLANLVSNALRHTPTGGRIILAANGESTQVNLSVQDTGSGIPADKLPHIFERFYRGDDSRYQPDGESGLGLAIARAIVEAHGGSISAHSIAEQGTTIKISLPRQSD